MKQEAQAQGLQEPDAAFEQRLQALRKSATSRTQVIHCCACSMTLLFHRSRDAFGRALMLSRNCPV